MVKEKIENILRKVAESENIKSYEIYPHTDALRGDGFVSDFYTGEVLDKSTGSKIQIYIKLPPTEIPHSFNSDAFYNEYRFYSTIYPQLHKFQREKDVNALFQNIARFYCGSDEDNSQFIVLENLKVQNYVLFEKAKFLNEEHLKTIFRIYGRFHALGFAFKDQNYDEYSEMMKPLRIIFGAEGNSLLPLIKQAFSTAFGALKDNNVKATEKIKSYIANFGEAFREATRYKGKYSTFIHGDCWSNNLLFKYKVNGQIEDVKVIDFQLSTESTPIHDLSYFFYSGASKEEFEKIDEYLELYHESFSSFAKELGSDPEKLLPLSILKSEWKNNSLLGIFLGIFAWQLKLTPKSNIDQMTSGTMKDELRENFKIVLGSQAFRKNASDILLHAIEHDII